MIDDVEQAIRDYLPNVIHMSLGTSVGNRPWVSEVHFVYDDELNLYWRSLALTRHSADIAENSCVAGNIVVQHAEGEKPRGVYFEGSAERLVDITVESPIYELFAKRFGFGSEIIEKAETNEGPHFYKVSVKTWYMFDARETVPAKKYRLNWKDIDLDGIAAKATA